MCESVAFNTFQNSIVNFCFHHTTQLDNVNIATTTTITTTTTDKNNNNNNNSNTNKNTNNRDNYTVVATPSGR